MTATVTAEAEPLHRALALSDEEYDAIVERLGREPNHAELAMFAAMWSEHCSYKSSRPPPGHAPHPKGLRHLQHAFPGLLGVP